MGTQGDKPTDLDHKYWSLLFALKKHGKTWKIRLFDRAIKGISFASKKPGFCQLFQEIYPAISQNKVTAKKHGNWWTWLSGVRLRPVLHSTVSGFNSLVRGRGKQVLDLDCPVVGFASPATASIPASKQYPSLIPNVPESLTTIDSSSWLQEIWFEWNKQWKQVHSEFAHDRRKVNKQVHKRKQRHKP